MVTHFTFKSVDQQTVASCQHIMYARLGRSWITLSAKFALAKADFNYYVQCRDVVLAKQLTI